MVPSADHTVWVYMGSTSHTVYVVRAQPFRDMALPWQKVLDYSCVWAEGQTTAAGTFDAIWDKIDDLNATDMKYWGATPLPPEAGTTKWLLKNKDGSCGAWARFFDDLCACQRITAAWKIIDPKPTSPYPGHAYLGFIVCEINFGPMRFNDDPPFRYRLSEIDVSPEGILGQGRETPSVKCFDDHVVNVYDGKIYDPSYGTGPYDDLHAWEEEAIEAYISTVTCAPPANDYKVKVNGTQETEVKWKD